MSKVYRAKKSEGITLIETIIYVAIFGMVIGSLVAFSSGLNSWRLRAQTLLEVNDQGASLMRAITQSIRNSSSINSPAAGNSGASLNLSTINPATNPISFFLAGETIYVTEGADSPIALSNNKVKISNLAFANLSRPSTPGVVQIRFTIGNASSVARAEEQYSLNFYGSAAIR